MLVLHASKALDSAAVRSVRERFPQIALPEVFETGGIVGAATLREVVSVSDSPWFVGPYGFVLADARPLPLFALKGQLGLFPASSDVLDYLARSDADAPRPIVP